MASNSYGEDTYQPSQLVQLFHSFPHIDMKFQLVNSTFNPDSVVYLESLGILAAIPGLWLIVNLFAFLIYFLTRCCQKEWKQKRNLTPIKWTLAILGLLCCGGIGIGFYGNNDADVAVYDFTSATNNMQDILHSVNNESRYLQMTLDQKMNSKLEQLINTFSKPGGNASVQVSLKQAVNNMKEEISKGLSSVQAINDKIDQIGTYTLPADVQKVEDFRWPVTMAVLSLFLVLCIVLFLGIIRHSRSVLITFSVLAFFVIIINWLLVSIYLVSSVALGDFCMDPEAYIRKEVVAKVDRTILDYYLDCHPGLPSPFSDAIRSGQKAVDTVEETFKFVKTTATTYYSEDKELYSNLNDISTCLNQTEATLGNIAALLDCRAMHQQYINALNSTCGRFIYGLAFLLLSAAATGTFFICLEWLTSNTWIYIRKKVYVPVDEQDPFLPPSSSSNSYRGRETYGSTAHRPRHIHTPPQTPPFPPSAQPFFCSNGRMPRIEDGPVQGRYTPPPLVS
ncbi:hypothetical protein CHUAL_003681 [Chamberlinius hualienensis]